MSPTPTVCAVMLTANRTELTRRAIQSFLSQTYPAKRLYIYDSGADACVEALPDRFREFGISYHNTFRRKDLRTIGELRNEANYWACCEIEPPEILVHWDSDDWSHANRIAEQVALLQASGAEAVGYREMLFWRESIHECAVHGTRFGGSIPVARSGQDCDLTGPDCMSSSTPGEAWLYSSGDTRYCLGTSLCYWRETWERKPFEATGRGEDWRWLSGIRSLGVTSVMPGYGDWPALHTAKEPRMIARIHPGNARNYDAADMLRSEKQGGEWRRVPAWDAHCRAVMA